MSDEQKVDLKFFGTKIFERLRFEKPTVYVERIVRHQYVKKDVVDTSDPPIVAAPTLPAIVEGCKYDFSVIAAIVAMKFAFHMSTYREQDYFGQSGWHPSRSTSNDLINYAVACIDPLFAQMSECVMKQSIVLGDATTLTVLLRDELSADDQRSLDNRKKKRHKELAAKLKSWLRRAAGTSLPAMDQPKVLLGCIVAWMLRVNFCKIGVWWISLLTLTHPSIRLQTLTIRVGATRRTTYFIGRSLKRTR
ncbi:MAG: transposase [Pirellulaceae bacterium]